MAKSVFDALGADTFVINNHPDGLNINVDCGSTHIEHLQKYVLDNGLDVGFAFDGDADRALRLTKRAMSSTGPYPVRMRKVHEGARNIRKLKVVTTIMSNMGLYKALDALGIGYEKTAVGDKYVAENMRQNGHLIGGEQSGHIIFGRLANTGDGLLTAIKVMEAITETKEPLSVLACGMTMYPQKLKNVIVTDKDETLNYEKVKAAVEAGRGRAWRQRRRPAPQERHRAAAARYGRRSTHELCEEKVDAIIAAMADAGKLVRVK